METEVSEAHGEQKWRNPVHPKSCCLKMHRDIHERAVREYSGPCECWSHRAFALMLQTAPSAEAVSVGNF